MRTTEYGLWYRVFISQTGSGRSKDPAPAEESSAPWNPASLGCGSRLPKLKDQDSDPSRCDSIRDGAAKGRQGNRPRYMAWGGAGRPRPRGSLSSLPPRLKAVWLSPNHHCRLRTSGHSQHPCRACHCPISQMKYQGLPGRQGQHQHSNPNPLYSRPFPLPRAAPRCKEGGPCPGHPPAQSPQAQLRPGLASKEALGSERNRD